MLAMAEQTLPVIGAPAPPPAATPSPSSVKLPPRASSTTTSQAEKLAAALGLLGLASVACLTLFLLWRQRELMRLREQVAQAMALEARRHGR
jgi:hypothetical protein